MVQPFIDSVCLCVMEYRDCWCTPVPDPKRRPHRSPYKWCVCECPLRTADDAALNRPCPNAQITQKWPHVLSRKDRIVQFCCSEECCQIQTTKFQHRLQQVEFDIIVVESAEALYGITSAKELEMTILCSERNDLERQLQDHTRCNGRREGYDKEPENVDPAHRANLQSRAAALQGR